MKWIEHSNMQYEDADADANQNKAQNSAVIRLSFDP